MGFGHQISVNKNHCFSQTSLTEGGKKMLAGTAVPLLSSPNLLVLLHPPRNRNPNPPPAPFIPPRVSYHLSKSFGILRTRSSRGSQAQWEAPDEGNDSDYEEKEEKEEDDDDDENGGGSGGISSAMASISEYGELPKEVELLLEPQEKAILQQHKVPDLTKVSTMKWNLLHSLALASQIPLMDKLLENGTDINSVDKDGFTALHKTVLGKKEQVISHLLRKGANPHVQDRNGATALHHAVQVGAEQTVRLLIKYKVDVNVADNDGWTPLHVAIQSRSRDIAKILLVNGADKSRRNKDGKTPLDICLCYGKDFKSYELAKLLKLLPVNRYL